MISNMPLLSLKERKRIKALEYYRRNREAINERNRLSRERAKAKDPEGWRNRVRAYNKTYQERNPDVRAKAQRRYREANAQRCKEAVRASVLKRVAADPDFYRKRNRQWREANPEHVRAYFRQWTAKKRQDPMFRLAASLRGRLKIALRLARVDGAVPRSYRDLEEAFEWLEWLAAQGVADWKADGMEIDHVVPVSRFNLGARDAQRAVNRWYNLFPLTKEENLRKSDKIVPEYYRRVRALVFAFINGRR